MRMKLIPFRLLVSRSFCNNRNCIPVWKLSTRITSRTISATPTQFFSITSSRCRNGPQENHARKQRKAPNVPTEAAEGDPFDFSPLESKIQHALAQLKDDLSKLKSGGRFNPDLVEGLRVHLVKGNKETLKLGDLAQVVPRGGRTIAVLVGEAEHIRPITSAILSSPYSLNPIPNPHSPLELTIPVPPPTQESRQKTLDQVGKVKGVAEAAVQNARAEQRKVLRAMELARKVRPDDLKKAMKKMEKAVEGGTAEVKGVAEGARKALGGG